MTINESYICPVCGKVGGIVGVQTLMEDVRFDVLECECGTSWRAYYKTSQVATEVVRVPEEKVNSEEPAVNITNKKPSTSKTKAE